MSNFCIKSFDSYICDIYNDKKNKRKYITRHNDSTFYQINKTKRIMPNLATGIQPVKMKNTKKRTPTHEYRNEHR